MRKTSLLPARQLTSQALKEGYKGNFLTKSALPFVLGAFLLETREMVTETVVANKKYLTEKTNLFFYSIAAYGAIILGIILMTTALALIVLAAFTSSDFNKFEVILIVSSFILLSIGAHSLDDIEKINKARRRAFYGRLKTGY